MSRKGKKPSGKPSSKRPERAARNARAETPIATEELLDPIGDTLAQAFSGVPAEASGIDLSDDDLIDDQAPGRTQPIDLARLPADPVERAEKLAAAWLTQRAAIKAQRIAGLQAPTAFELRLRRALAEALAEAGDEA